jgi:hypothetical protein
MKKHNVKGEEGTAIGAGGTDSSGGHLALLATDQRSHLTLAGSGRLAL